ncbi:sensor histidine kinase [Microbacterium pumilum]|uniref:Sensor histidine kinase n=1 Tax=Microbacterium pumilum TaxID=344165 RepID=A0ABP5E4Z1_9MICO
MSPEPQPVAPTGSPPAGAAGAPWLTIADGSAGRMASDAAPIRPRRVVLRLAAGLLVVLIAVALLGAFAAQLLAEREAVNDAANITDVFAEAVIQPSLTDALADGDPDAVDAFDAVVRERVLGPGVVRVKIWTPGGTILYADEPELIGRTFELDLPQREALADPQTRAEVSDLSNSENEFESGDRLLEVYRPVWTPDGRQLLFEMYAPYDPVATRSGELWRGFAGVTVSTLLLLVVLTAPIVWRLLNRARRDESDRAALLQHAVDASDVERRRIAGTLHDGPVQELIATTFAAENAASVASAHGEDGLADDVRDVASSVRGNVRALRSLLVDIYPPSLADAGIAQALADLAAGVRGRGVEASVDVSAELPELSDGEQRLIYRVAQECLRNIAAHASPGQAWVRLFPMEGASVLEVVDDGPGFDPASLRDPPEGHFGTRIVGDLATEAGARLEVATAPGAGTAWRLTVPRAADRGSS